MAVAEIFTKWRISDIKATDDHVDIQYAKRIEAMKTRDDLRDILRDYEEFLPKGIQRLRDISNEGFRELIFRIRRFVQACKNKQPPPGEPTEAIILCTPPMLTIPRGFARQMNYERSQKGITEKVTFGEVILKLGSEGYLTKIMENQENMYTLTVKLEKHVKETFQVSGKPELH